MSSPTKLRLVRRDIHPHVARFMRACWQDPRVRRVGLVNQYGNHVEVVVELPKLDGEGTKTDANAISCVSLEDIDDPEDAGRAFVRLSIEALDRRMRNGRLRKRELAPAPLVLLRGVR